MPKLSVAYHVSSITNDSLDPNLQAVQFQACRFPFQLIGIHYSYRLDTHHRHHQLRSHEDSPEALCQRLAVRCNGFFFRVFLFPFFSSCGGGAAEKKKRYLKGVVFSFIAKD